MKVIAVLDLPDDEIQENSFTATDISTALVARLDEFYPKGDYIAVASVAVLTDPETAPLVADLAAFLIEKQA